MRGRGDEQREGGRYTSSAYALNRLHAQTYLLHLLTCTLQYMAVASSREGCILPNHIFVDVLQPHAAKNMLANSGQYVIFGFVAVKERLAYTCTIFTSTCILT